MTCAGHEPSTTEPQDWKTVARGLGSKSTACLPNRTESLVQHVQARLSCMAAKRGELPALQTAIAQLPRLVAEALATPKPKVSEAALAKRKAQAARLKRPGLQFRLMRARLARRRYAPARPTPPPPKPYAPYRWPPLRVTAMALKGASAAPAGGVARPMAAAQQPHGSLQRLGSDELEELLDMAEEFEGKLHLKPRNYPGSSSKPDKEGSGGLVLRHMEDADGCERYEIRIQRPQGCAKKGRGRDHPNHHRGSNKPEVGVWSA
ncbi:hypothetical protein GPECTOR_21g735 [Gonium pectorale]|uniref:Uncharacterized protein n=1 Tax=Gonium pectorale TaxID=33097 RepID=A0A150GIA1_GONPE|nr:hypothetical protein GPECTOR_21g735 [Gonium pectorale]|eukprot:KXZ49509.1 hypothetical protein GPECTOR_21g735 [Gonium pectorale]